MNKLALSILSGFFSLILVGPVFAWEYPVIKGYGPVQALPKAMVQPDKTLKYKVLFDITGESKETNKANPGLSHLARFINVMASGGVMPKDMGLVAIIHGAAAPVVLKNEIFRKKYNGDNPNLKLIRDLKAAGVQLYVCGQALADDEFRHEWVNPEVSIALSALVFVPTYQLKGYAYQPFF
jgi:intracellular sulfur oxidation DsrE/DsrF family protein